jgi:hypothetical protein
MRVEVVEKLEQCAGGSGEPGNPGASLAIKNFLGTIESDDSLFSVAQPLTAPASQELGGNCICAADVVLTFRRSELAGDRRLYLVLCEKLIELLKNAGSREFLEARLWLTPAGRDRSRQQGHELWLQLRATGETREQAALRWGLGLAHMQQALLFASRLLRQYLAQSEK